MDKYLLLKGKTEEEITEAASLWFGLMAASRMECHVHAGFKGDWFPVDRPDDRVLTISMWTRFDIEGLEKKEASCKHARELLTEFAHQMREIHYTDSQSSSESDPE